MKKFLKVTGVLFLLVILAGLFLIYRYGPNFNVYLVPPSVEKYTQTALQFMEQGYFTDSDHWQAAKKQAMETAAGADRYEETHEDLENAIRVAGGKHSFLMNKDEADTTAGTQELPEIRMEDAVLYIHLTPIMLADPVKNQAYADLVLQHVEKENYDGVILDLSDNTGGDMGPMLAGLSPLLPDGTILFFQDVAGNRTDVQLAEGSLSMGGSAVQGSKTKVQSVPIAVILNERTASSAEIVALAFKTAENVKYFGTPSAGYTSGNSQLRLYDGTILQLTTASLVDASGQEYMNVPIEPDESSDNPLRAAVEWIHAQ